MGVLIKKNDKFDDLQSTSFPLELDLSKLIIYNPEVFPIRNYSEEGEKWFPVSVEVGLETGELDILGIDDAGGMELAKRSRGTPRIANRILKRTRDYAQVKADGKINKSIANESLKALGIDKFGLDGMDRTILSTLIEKFEGGPVGVNSLSVAVSEDASTIEDVYEPYLIKQGFIQRTNRGRIAQEKAYKLFNKTITNKQQGLFK